MQHKLYQFFIKRPIGFIGALMAILLLSPLLIVVTVWLTIANKGAGAFFFQQRPGRDCKIIKVMKFKSMTDERGEDGNLLPDAQRLTSVGRFVRKTSIDELPQLFNILKGDMAFIGPRPLLVKYLPWYTKREQLRHTVRPGISGWAQVHGRNNLEWDERLECDAYYAEHISLLLDCKIFIMSVINVFSGSDIEVAPSESHDLDVIRSKNNRYYEHTL